MANKYMYFYLCGPGHPASEAKGKAMLTIWMGYFGKLGSALVEGAAPFAPNSAGKGSASHASGYSIVRADSLDKVIKMTDVGPHIARSGGIEVFELARVPGM